jgi:hypothetical protein
VPSSICSAPASSKQHDKTNTSTKLAEEPNRDPTRKGDNILILKTNMPGWWSPNRRRLEPATSAPAEGKNAGSLFSGVVNEPIMLSNLGGFAFIWERSGKSKLTGNTVREPATLNSQVEDGELGGAVSARHWRATEAGEHEEKIL